MSRINRYKIAKMLHPDYVILLLDKDRYITYDNDFEIIKFIKLKKSCKVLKKHNINYLVLDNLDIIDMKSYDNNNYDRYLKLIMLNKILNCIGNNLTEVSLL